MVDKCVSCGRKMYQNFCFCDIENIEVKIHGTGGVGDFIGDDVPITQSCPTCEQLAKEVSLLQKQLKQARSELRGVKKLNEELEREGYNR